MVEHFLGKEEVAGSIPFISSSKVKSYGCSSIGRATVSKTVGWGFKSLLPCLVEIVIITNILSYLHSIAVMIAKIKDIFADVSKEMKKVSWPTRQQLKESTLVVLGTCASVTFFVWVVDLIMAFVIKRLIF